MNTPELLELIEHWVEKAIYEAVLPNFDIKTNSAYLTQLVQKATNDPGFKSWFAGSKVVDSQGMPMLVFHATNKDFQNFSKDKLDTSGTSINTNLLGFFFTNSADVASTYIAKQFDPKKGFKNNSQIKMFFLRLKKPIYISERQYWGLSRMSKVEIQDYVDRLKSAGYDGIIMPSVWRGKGKGYDFVAFDDSSIKPVNA